MEEKENSISLMDIFRVLWKNVILLAIITVVITVLGIVYTVGIAKPTYKSSSSIIVAVESQSTATDVDYTNSLRAVVTVADSIKESKILEPVAKEYSLTVKQLSNKITISNSTSSMKITITVIDTDPKRAMELAQKIANRCIEEAVDVKEDGTQGVFFFANNSIVSTSDATMGIYNSPNKKLYVLVSFVLGLVVSFVVIFIKEFMSSRFKTRTEIEKAFEEKVIGLFPDDKSKEKDSKNSKKDVTLVTPSIRSFEPYNKLLSNIKYSNLENPYKVIMFTSTIMNELKSTMASNFAYCIANNHYKVIILDFDIRKAVLHRTFKVERDNGIVEYADGSITKEQLIKHTEYGVDVITAGKTVLNPVAVLETTKIKQLIEDLRSEYDYIIVDTPPALACSDYQIISTYCDGAVYNIAVNQARKKDIAECINNLKCVDGKIIGLNVTKADCSKRSGYYYYYNNAYTDTEESSN